MVDQAVIDRVLAQQAEFQKYYNAFHEFYTGKSLLLCQEIYRGLGYDIKIVKHDVPVTLEAKPYRVTFWVKDLKVVHISEG